jgi:hypothetical protein
MKYVFFFVFSFLLHPSCFSQILTPVKWKHSVTKGVNNTYTVTFTCTIESGWHVYAQVQPKKAIANPLQITFDKNPLVTLQGKPKEIGKMIKAVDKSTGIEDYHYANNLKVVQTVKLKSTTKTKLSGVLTYQTCNNERCLPPAEVEFSLSL